MMVSILFISAVHIFSEWAIAERPSDVGDISNRANYSFVYAASLNGHGRWARSKRQANAIAARSQTLGFLDDGKSKYVWSGEFAPKSISNDWLFGVRTTSCSGISFDNDSDSLLSRMLLPSLLMMCVFAISLTSRQSERAAQNPGTVASDTFDTQRDQPTSLSQETVTKARVRHLDFARICAVMCIICEHSGGDGYSRRNVIFSLWWVLPYLYMTSGIAFMMSKRSLVNYAARLVCVFAVGVTANWIADVINHRAWAADFGNTIFQMWYVVMLVVMAILTAPLRAALQRRRDDMVVEPTRITLLAALFSGFVSLVALWYFSRVPHVKGNSYGILQNHGPIAWAQYYAPILKHLPIFVVLICGMLFLSLYATIVAKPENTGFVGWFLLAYIYVPSVMIPWDQSGFSHLMTLYVFSMVTTVFPLAGTETISRCVRAYWPFLLMILCLASMPDMWGRCDVHPPYATWERLRLNFGEITLIVCFVTNAFSPDDPYKVTVWMGWWSLFAYCFHVMWFRLLGSPYGAIVTFSFMGIFYALHVWRGTVDSKK